MTVKDGVTVKILELPGVSGRLLLRQCGLFSGDGLYFSKKLWSSSRLWRIVIPVGQGWSTLNLKENQADREKVRSVNCWLPRSILVPWWLLMGNPNLPGPSR